MEIKKDDKVKLDYEGKFETGKTFDSSKHGNHSHPLEFVVGAGQVIPGFEKAVLGMKKGEEKEFSIESNEAYGDYDNSLKKDIPRNTFPAEQDVKEGMIVVMQTPNGQKIPAKIASVKKDSITIDLNHPLAGKKLIFNVKVLDIKNSQDNHLM